MELGTTTLRRRCDACFAQHIIPGPRSCRVESRSRGTRIGRYESSKLREANDEVMDASRRAEYRSVCTEAEDGKRLRDLHVAPSMPNRVALGSALWPVPTLPLSTSPLHTALPPRCPSRREYVPLHILKFGFASCCSRSTRRSNFSPCPPILVFDSRARLCMLNLPDFCSTSIQNANLCFLFAE